MGDADSGATRIAFTNRWLHPFAASSWTHPTRSCPARSIEMANAKTDFSDDRFIRSIIERKIRQTIDTSSFANHEREDLEQEIYIRVAKSVESVASGKSSQPSG